jgi:hypothetical protein
LANTVPSFIVFVPGLVVVSRFVAKGAQHAFEVVFVLQPDVMLDESHPSRCPVFWN